MPPQSGRSRRRRLGKVNLFSLLGLVDDIVDWKAFDGGLVIRHHCACDSTRGWCSNPFHLSVGTDVENAKDIPHERKQKRASKAGRTASKLRTGIHAKWVSTIDGFIGNSGNVAKHNRFIGGRGHERTRLSPEEAAFVFAWGP